MQNNFPMGVKFWTSWGTPKIFSKSYCYDDFLKNGFKSNFLKNFTRDFPLISFIGDFHLKLKVSFEFFTRDFSGKKIKWKIFLKGFLLKIEAKGKILKGFSL